MVRLAAEATRLRSELAMPGGDKKGSRRNARSQVENWRPRRTRGEQPSSEEVTMEAAWSWSEARPKEKRKENGRRRTVAVAGEERRRQSMAKGFGLDRNVV